MSDINVFTGPMKSGKSQKIINEAYRQIIAGKKIQMFKPKLDTREQECVADRNGNKLMAVNIQDMNEIENYFRLNIVKMKKLNRGWYRVKARLMVLSFFVFIIYFKHNLL